MIIHKLRSIFAFTALTLCGLNVNAEGLDLKQNHDIAQAMGYDLPNIGQLIPFPFGEFRRNEGKTVVTYDDGSVFRLDHVFLDYVDSKAIISFKIKSDCAKYYEVGGFVEQAFYVDGQAIRMAVVCGPEVQVATPATVEGREYLINAFIEKGLGNR